MSMTISELSLTAHERALKYGGPVPAERGELSHLPMRMYGGTPIFDETRMRDDQVEELEQRLRVLGGFVRARKVEEQVHDFLALHGHTGVRVQDMVDDLGASKRSVLRYVSRLILAGKVAVREEKNPRGNGASRRKRYYWVDSFDDFGPIEEVDGLAVSNDRRDTNDGPGIINHWTGMGELQGCGRGCCAGRLRDSLHMEAISSARRAGGSGFAEGVAWMEQRRYAEEREAERVDALVRGLLR